MQKVNILTITYILNFLGSEKFCMTIGGDKIIIYFQ